MAGSRRILREKATAALSALLERICAGGAHADCVTAVYVFGSYARGALTVGDVDVDIEYDAKLHPAVERELIDNLVVGRDWNTPLRTALKPARALQVIFSRLEMIAEPVLVYERGDTLDQALARIASIVLDPEAGRADRDPVHPAIEPIADDLARPTRILLSELLAEGLLDLEIIDLADAEEDELSDESFVFETRLRWRSAASPCGARCRRALAGVRRRPRPRRSDAGQRARPVGERWAIDCRETHLRRIVAYLGHNRVCDALFVLHPRRKRPLRALRITASDPSALPYSDIDGWLSQRAPQIHRIG